MLEAPRAKLRHETMCVCVCVCEVVWQEGCSEADWLWVKGGPLVGAQSSKEAMVSRDAGRERTCF